MARLPPLLVLALCLSQLGCGRSINIRCTQDAVDKTCRCADSSTGDAALPCSAATVTAFGAASPVCCATLNYPEPPTESGNGIIQCGCFSSTAECPGGSDNPFSYTSDELIVRVSSCN